MIQISSRNKKFKYFTRPQPIDYLCLLHVLRVKDILQAYISRAVLSVVLANKSARLHITEKEDFCEYTLKL